MLVSGYHLFWWHTHLKQILSLYRGLILSHDAKDSWLILMLRSVFSGLRLNVCVHAWWLNPWTITCTTVNTLKKHEVSVHQRHFQHLKMCVWNKLVYECVWLDGFCLHPTGVLMLLLLVQIWVHLNQIRNFTKLLIWSWGKDQGH